MAPSPPFAAAKRTLAMVASVLLPVQPKNTGMRGVFIFAVSTMICLFSSGASIDVSPVEPMISTADVPCSSWNFSKLRNAPKSTEPSLLKGVISATNEPVSIFFDIAVSMAQFRGGALGRSAPPGRGAERCSRFACLYRVVWRGRLQPSLAPRAGRRGHTAQSIANGWCSDRGDQRRWREGAHRRRRLLPALDLDQRGERTGTLAQGRRADVEGQHVGVAVPLRLACRIRRIDPGAG